MDQKFPKRKERDIWKMTKMSAGMNVLEASQKNQENYLTFCQSEARGHELIITAFAELCTIISGIKNGDKVKAGVNFRQGRLNTMREQA